MAAVEGRAGAFHQRHGVNIKLLESNSVAHRVESYNKAVVYTELPIPSGGVFQVRLLDKGGGWAGSIVSWPPALSYLPLSNWSTPSSVANN